MGVYFSSTFNFLSLVLGTSKEYKEYREANPGPHTAKSFHTWIRFGGKDRPGFVWKERTEKRKSTFRKKKKVKMIKMTIKIKDYLG